MNDKLARPHPESVYSRLKARTRRLVDMCGGVESAATITRGGFQALSKYGRPQEGLFCPIDIVADLETDAGDPVITRELAALSGFVLVRVPSTERSPTWLGGIAAVAKEAGEVVGRIGEALADGDVSADDIRTLQLREECRHAIEALAAIDAALAAVNQA